jgi:hypothetical protein
MKYATILFLSVGVTFAEDIPFDPKKPSLLKPSSVYAFVITPKEGVAPSTIRLHTESTSEFKTPEGLHFAPIEKITVQQAGKEYDLEYEYVDIGVPNMDLTDFDGDGFLDFRIITAWGTGGSWYCYYKFEDGNFRRWTEPEELGINGLPEAGKIASYGRSGPESSAVFYEFKEGRFQKRRVESILLKDSLPELNDWKTTDVIVISVVEEWDEGRLIRRTLEPKYETE